MTSTTVGKSIISVPSIKATRDRCWDVYQQLKNGTSIHDPQALDVLDIILRKIGRNNPILV
ncbi:hypothetical protein ACKFKG_13275 [Phormidesmis sp. 146-35]